MPTGWTLRGGDTSTICYAIILNNGNIVTGTLATGTTIPGPTLQSEAALSTGTCAVTAYLNSTIALANKNTLVLVGTGYGQDSTHPGSIMFKAATTGPVGLTAGNYGVILSLTVSSLPKEWPAYWKIPLQITTAPV
jgi:hypothetical protein